MKKIFSLLLAFALIQSAALFAQIKPDSLAKTSATVSDEFTSILQDTYSDFDSAKSVMDMLTASNRFGLIA